MTIGATTIDREEVDTALEKRAVLLLDLTVLPMMTLLYLLSFMDRSNIGNARIAGLQHDLNLTDHQYQICVCLFYVPYLFFELPSNLLLRTIGPQIMLPAATTLWGVVVVTQGFVSSYTGLIVIRLLLGALEGPLYPGIILYLSGFYTRQELSLRVAAFISAASLSGAFSGLLATALVKLDGAGGRPGWAWIFIVARICTVLVGLTGFYVMPSTPANSRFLSPAQKEVITRRLERSKPHGNYADNFSVKQIYLSITSPHCLLMFLVAFAIGSNSIGIANFLPSIVKQLGYALTTSQLLTVGPYTSAFILTLTTAYLSDRHKTRSLPLICVSLIGAIGFAIYLSSHNKHLSYASLFLAASGSFAMSPLASSWLTNNSDPHYRRATSIAVLNIFSSSGSILSTWRFPTKEGPRFTKTTIMNMCFALLVAVLAAINAAYLAKQNRKKKVTRENLLAPYADEKDGYDEARAWNELGDRHPDFQYVL
ncbi:MFS general substrate transporter [Panaeolus papilionaceus]|nr:MFS general substrate transporter [Panaeolus papilionaceus]